MGYGITRKPKNMGEAVRFFCLECQGGYDPHVTPSGKLEEGYMPYQAVRECPDQQCQLYPYRFGKCPARQKAAKARAADSNFKAEGSVSCLPVPEKSSGRRREAKNGYEHGPVKSAMLF